MGRLTTSGYEADSLTTWQGRIRDIFRNALGADLDVAAESPQGQLISGVALMLTEVDEANAAISNGTSRYRSIGQQLDDIGSLLLIPRLPAQPSTVTVTLTGAAGTVIAQDARARSATGDIFEMAAAATIGGGGSVSAIMQAVEDGPIEAAAGTITEIIDLVPGWTAITNPAAAVLGRLRESDVAYRARQERLLAKNAQAAVEAIRAMILAISGVTDAIVHDNPTALDVEVQSVTIAARSILAIVEGGADADIAAAIAQAKAPGTPMTGAITVQVPQRAGALTTPIKFSRVTPVPLTVVIDTTFGPNFPGNGAAQIIERVVDWAAGEWQSGQGDFDTTGLAIGEALDERRLYAPILSVPGHAVQSITVQRKSTSAAIGPVLLTERLTIAAADVSVS